MSEEKTSFTVIICCYNGETRIGRVIDTILDQVDVQRFVKEIVVVDNHSTDKTKEIILNYVGNELAVPIRYVYEEKPGLSNARKAGIDNCATKWTVFLDDDNFIENNWFDAINRYIANHPNVGALNGAVIPKVDFDLAVDDELRLKASVKVLACTHYNHEEIRESPKTPFCNPIGAGMVILTEPLKQLSASVWLNSAGRTKDNLTSGEDGEMAFYLKNHGYEFGFCSDAVLQHEMTPGRLKDEYLNKMWYEIGRGVAIVAKKQHTGAVKLFCYRVLLQGRLILYSLENRYKATYYKRYIRGYFDEL